MTAICGDQIRDGKCAPGRPWRSAMGHPGRPDRGCISPLRGAHCFIEHNAAVNRDVTPMCWRGATGSAAQRQPPWGACRAPRIHPCANPNIRPGLSICVSIRSPIESGMAGKSRQAQRRRPGIGPFVEFTSVSPRSIVVAMAEPEASHKSVPLRGVCVRVKRQAMYFRCRFINSLRPARSGTEVLRVAGPKNAGGWLRELGAGRSRWP